MYCDLCGNGVHAWHQLHFILYNGGDAFHFCGDCLEHNPHLCQKLNFYWNLEKITISQQCTIPYWKLPYRKNYEYNGQALFYFDFTTTKPK